MVNIVTADPKLINVGLPLLGAAAWIPVTLRSLRRRDTVPGTPGKTSPQRRVRHPECKENNQSTPKQ
jgi:hypothetical protein